MKNTQPFKMIKIKDLKKGDRIENINNGASQIISLIKNELTYYNEYTREFKTKKVDINDYVYLAE